LRSRPTITTDVCINSSITDSRGNGQGTKNDCAQVDTPGMLDNRARIIVTVRGTLTIAVYMP
jgi:hypothetical protein